MPAKPITQPIGDNATEKITSLKSVCAAWGQNGCTWRVLFLPLRPLPGGSGQHLVCHMDNLFLQAVEGISTPLASAGVVQLLGLPSLHYGGCIKPHYLNWCLADPISSTQRDVIKAVLVAVAWVAMDTSKLILYHGKEYMLLSSHTHRMSIGNQSVPQLLYWWLAASAMTSHKLGCSLR